MSTEKSIEQTTAEREAYDRDPAGYLASHEMTHGLKIHIMRGEVKLTHAAEKARLEAELAAMTAERDEWKRIAQDNARNESRLESVSERLRGDVAKLEAECAAWREMARAERHAAGARLHGNGEQRAEAFRRLGAAEGALRDLGIDPHA